MSNIELYRKRAQEERIANFDHVAKSTYTAEAPKLRKLKIKIGRKQEVGSHVAIYTPAGLNRLYGRKNLCLKMFTGSKHNWGKSDSFGKSKITESTIVQNLMAIRGLAPRVYELVDVGGKVCQVTEYLKGNPTTDEISDDRFIFHNDEATQPHNQIGGKLVDFQGAIFKDFHKTKKELLNRAYTKTSFPRHEMNLYQTTDYCAGKRKTKERLELYKFPDFKGKTILDIGCNLGMLMRAAYDKNAVRVVGIDWPDLVEHSRELAIMDSYFNLDFHGVDVKKRTHEEIQKITGIKQFDIHFFFAMEMWVGWPEWVKQVETLYYEGHGVVRPFSVDHYKDGKKV